MALKFWKKQPPTPTVGQTVLGTIAFGALMQVGALAVNAVVEGIDNALERRKARKAVLDAAIAGLPAQPQQPRA